MNLAPEIEAFLNENRFAVLATINADGTPQQSVMWYALHDDAILMNTRYGRVKHLNLSQDSRASICVEDEQRYVTIRGTVSIDDDPNRGLDSALVLATRYDGPEKAREIVDKEFRHQHRITLTMCIEQTDVHGFDG